MITNMISRGREHYWPSTSLLAITCALSRHPSPHTCDNQGLFHKQNNYQTLFIKYEKNTFISSYIKYTHSVEELFFDESTFRDLNLFTNVKKLTVSLQHIHAHAIHSQEVKHNLYCTGVRYLEIVDIRKPEVDVTQLLQLSLKTGMLPM